MFDYKGGKMSLLRCIGLSCVLPFSLLLSPSASAGDIWPLFHELKRSPDSFEVTGVVCEEVAKLELEKEYDPAHYDVVTGVAYKKGGKVIGELDVVIFRKSDGEAVVVAEVKCWKKLGAARKKAREQQERFRRTMDESTQGLRLYDVHDPSIIYRPTQFDGNPEMFAISQDGGESAGFEMTLDYSLAELMHLRELVLGCQRSNKCKGPAAEGLAEIE